MVLGAGDDSRERLEPVLRALDGAPASEVVVVTGPGASLDVGAVLGPAGSGPHALVAAPTPHHLTDVESANFGLRHTRGAWVHVLGPDAPASSFYEAMGAAVTAPGVPLAVGHQGHLERALDLDFAMRSSWFVAARHLYEQAGGFCASMPFAAPWEMFQRLAHTAAMPPASVPVPLPLHPAPAHTAGSSPASLGYGEEVVHWLAAIDLVCDTAVLPPTDVVGLHDRCARRAAELVRDDVEEGRFGSALATVGEALRVPTTANARDHLATALGRTLR
jgi:hypothetical protein